MDYIIELHKGGYLLTKSKSPSKLESSEFFVFWSIDEKAIALKECLSKIVDDELNVKYQGEAIHFVHLEIRRGRDSKCDDLPFPRIKSAE